MLFKCWPSVFDAGPAFKHWMNASCLLGAYLVMICTDDCTVLLFLQDYIYIFKNHTAHGNGTLHGIPRKNIYTTQAIYPVVVDFGQDNDHFLILHPAVQPLTGENPCDGDYLDYCGYSCFPAPSPPDGSQVQVICACPDGVSLHIDGKTCCKICKL